MMFLLTAVVAFAAAVLHGGGLGDLFDKINWWERCARLGVLGVIVAAFVGMWARIGSDYLWIHWVLLAALAATVGGYLGLYVEAHRARRR